MKKIIFVSNYSFIVESQGFGMSGGDRILIELIKQWQIKNQILFFGTEESIELLKRNNIENISFLETSKKALSKGFGLRYLIIHNIRKLFVAVTSAFTFAKELKNFDYVYSVSDFWPDLIPSLIIKAMNPKIKLIAASYFFAPKPWSKDNPYNTSFGRFITGLGYWISQRTAYNLIVRFADFVVLCNRIDEEYFIRDGFKKNNLITIYGGVNVRYANSIRVSKKKYDGVFMARFHSQKGPLYAVKAWKEVLRQKPKARLAMIGNGPDEQIVKDYVLKNNLSKNVDFFGFLDGAEKYKILKSSRIYIHSAIYETGGMATAEAMSAGLPVIAFDHKGYDYIYPKGILRIKPVGSYKKMADGIINLIKNKTLHLRLKNEALDLVKNEWDWSKRAAFVYKKLTQS